MHTFYHPGHDRHDPAQLHRPGNTRKNVYYSEVAERGKVIVAALEAADLGPIVEPDDFGMQPIAEIHEYGMLNLLQTAFDRMQNEEDSQLAIPTTFNLSRLTSQRRPQRIWGLLGHYCYDNGSPIFQDTWEAAYWSAQTAIHAAARVAENDSGFAYALCRPPGHHAGSDFYGGFCYLNNVAIAAGWLVSQGQRVAILDLDYHHGNGTQSIFYRRSDVLTCSIHADPFSEYPYFWGYADEYGMGAGKNHNFNYPLSHGAGENEYLHMLEDALAQVRHFVPNTLLIAFGVDTLAGDPVGRFELDSGSLGRMGRMIRELGLPTVIVQEGGYLLPELGANVVNFLNELTRE